MRKPNSYWLFVITIVFCAFILGFLLGRSQDVTEITVSVPQEFMTAPPPETEAVETTAEETEAITFPISLNHADQQLLMALPGIGEVLARRILDYREENGPFSSPEDLLNVEGIGKKRLEEILDLISIGG